MKLTVKGTEIDAAALLCGLYNRALPYEKGQPQMTMAQARGLLSGNGMHCDFDRVGGRAVCMVVDQATGVVRRTDLYETVNGVGSFDAAFALALELEKQNPEPPPCEATEEVL